MPTATLSNGLRVIFEPSASEVLYCGYVVCAGTRHEPEADSGMAHFLEHLSFKGTTRRTSTQINNFLERVGGDLNAFTNKQETVYHATVLRKDVARAVDLLTDIVFHSTYPQAEITKEVEVIVDEIDSYRDSPSELIFDEFEHLLFADAPLGRDILGTPERLRQYTTADAHRFADRYYRPDNAIFFVYGQTDFARVLRLLSKAHQAEVATAPPSVTEVRPGEAAAPTAFKGYATPTTRIVQKDTHQAHVMMGAPTFGSNDPRRFALILLNNLLGGPGMNSRLNMVVRERHGLVYSIDAYLNSYPDAGYWNVYFGCDADDVKRCLRLVKRELQKLAEKPLTPAQLKAAKDQLCGQIGISCDNREGYALAMAKTFAHFGRHRNVADVVAAIREVTAEQLQKLAAEIYAPERLFTLIYQ